MAKREVGVEILKNSVPRIFIPWAVNEDINAIVQTKTGEIGWIGEARRSKDDRNLFIIDKVTVPLQEANGSTTEISDEGLLKIYEDEADTFDMDRFRYWGHSHGNIGSVYPSSQDDQSMKSFAETCDWFIGTIHNRQGNVFGYAVDTKIGIYYTDIEVTIGFPEEVSEIYTEIYRLEAEAEELLEKLETERASRDWEAISKANVKNKYYGNHNYQGRPASQVVYVQGKPATWNPQTKRFEPNESDETSNNTGSTQGGSKSKKNTLVGITSQKELPRGGRKRKGKKKMNYQNNNQPRRR